MPALMQGKLFCTCVVHASLAAAAFGAPPSGVSVNSDGALVRDGKTYRAIGVNYYDCFVRTLDDPANTTYAAGFEELKQFGVPFVRFSAGGYWPDTWKKFLDDRESYLRLLDGVVRCAESNGVGLIPSLFWQNCAIPDLVGEPRSALGDPASKTNAFIREYTTTVVSRYANSPAIWGWEFGNEYDLAVDLPNAAEHRPHIVPHRGTPPARSAADDLSHDMILTAFQTFASAVRAVDAERPVFTGNSLPRGASWHMRHENSWTQDTREQLVEQLGLFNPPPFDTYSVHVYPHDHEKRFGQRRTSYDELLELATAAARREKRVLCVGEFGASDAAEEGGKEFAREEIHEFITALDRHDVPLAAAWVYDFAAQDADLSFTGSNARKYVLKAIQLANQRWESCSESTRAVRIAGGNFRGTLMDFVANAGRSGNGFNPLQHGAFRGENLYRDEMTGLYFEHIFNGTKADHELAMFTPNRDIHHVRNIDESTAVMVHPAEHSSWAIGSEMRYTLSGDAVDLEFKATPAESRFPLGFCAFMWASYMNHTRERRIHFYGTENGREGWITFGDDTADGFETGTVAHAQAVDLPYEEGAQTLNLIESKTKRFLLPFYYGLVDGDGDFATQDDTMAYIMMFDQQEPIRFAVWNFIRDAERNPYPHSPAWDWQFVIRNPEPGKQYGYRARVMYKLFVSADDVREEYEKWQGSLGGVEPGLTAPRGPAPALP